MKTSAKYNKSLIKYNANICKKIWDACKAWMGRFQTTGDYTMCRIVHVIICCASCLAWYLMRHMLARDCRDQS